MEGSSEGIGSLGCVGTACRVLHGKSPMPPSSLPAIHKDKIARKSGSFVCKLRFMSDDFIVIRKILLFRGFQQSVYVFDVGAHLGAEVGAARVAVVVPALQLHDEQIEEGHDGDVVDGDDVVGTDLGKPEGRWDEDVDLHASTL